MKVTEQIVLLVRNHAYNHRGSYPNAIFVGREEWYKLKSEAEVFIRLSEEKPYKFMGIDLYEINIDKFLKVGNVEGLTHIINKE